MGTSELTRIFRRCCLCRLANAVFHFHARKLFFHLSCTLFYELCTLLRRSSRASASTAHHADDSSHDESDDGFHDESSFAAPESST